MWRTRVIDGRVQFGASMRPIHFHATEGHGWIRGGTMTSYKEEKVEFLLRYMAKLFFSAKRGLERCTKNSDVELFGAVSVTFVKLESP